MTIRPLYESDPLSLPQMLRLIEIAHETKNDNIRDAALKVVFLSLAPPFWAVATQPAHPQNLP
jgi:hypothetical protein